MRARRLGPTVLAAGCFLGCASTDATTQNELSRIRRDVAGLQAELTETRASISRLETQLTLLASRPAAVAGGEGDRGRPPRSAAAARPGLPIVRLPARADGDRAASAPLAQGSEFGAQDDGGPPVLIKAGPDPEDRLPVDREVLKRPDPLATAEEQHRPEPSSPPARASASDQYRDALAALRDRHNPEDARVLLSAFRARHPTSDLTANAAYWLAECSFEEERFEAAATEFLRMTKEFPASSKVPDALLRAGQSYEKLGEAKRATELLRRVTKSYPSSEAAQKARAALDQGSEGEER